MFCFHKWVLIMDTKKHRYFECSKCGKRKVNIMFEEGYQPIDYDWLNHKKHNCLCGFPLPPKIRHIKESGQTIYVSTEFKCPSCGQVTIY